MKNWIKNISLKRINLYFLHVFVVLLSFHEAIIPLTLTLYLILNLVSVPWSERVFFFKKRIIFILGFISLYVFSIIGMLYTVNLQDGWFDLEVKLSMFLVPIFLLTSNVINKYTVFGLLKSFIFGVSAALIILLMVAFFDFSNSGNINVFFYDLLSKFHHPTYFAMYLNFSIASLLVLIFHYRDRPQLRHFALLGFLVIGIYQLSSRTGLLTLILLLLFAFVYIIFPKLKWKRMLYAFFTTVFMSMAILYPVSQYTKSFRKVNTTSSGSSSGVRLAMWESALPLIKENFLFGVGTGDVNRELQIQFSKDKLLRAVRNNYNAHNQFIQTQVALGLMGTLALLFGLFYPLYVSIRRGKLFYPLFCLILLINFLTESVFNTMAGVVYFSIMNAIVFFTYEE